MKAPRRRNPGPAGTPDPGRGSVESGSVNYEYPNFPPAKKQQGPMPIGEIAFEVVARIGGRPSGGGGHG